MQQVAESRVARQALQAKGHGATGSRHVPRPATALNGFGQLEKSPTCTLMSAPDISLIFWQFSPEKAEESTIRLAGITAAIPFVVRGLSGTHIEN